MLKNKPTLVKKSQGLYSQLRQARDSGQGQVIYNFEVDREVFNKETKSFEIKKHKWSQQQPINPDIFFTSKGRFEDLEKVAEIFKDTAHDLGAKYFTV